MALLSIEIGILSGVACATNMEFDCALDFYEKAETEAKNLNFMTKVEEIQTLIQQLREERLRAAEQITPNRSLSDSHKLNEYISNVQKIVRTCHEGRESV